ncbi:MAG: hypothetical protein HOA17_09640 [Candidatus Melainabacteria bacterium]|nr:hypothetical protein [Candidatus Melainabacteria bacterium]
MDPDDSHDHDRIRAMKLAENILKVDKDKNVFVATRDLQSPSPIAIEAEDAQTFIKRSSQSASNML